ncbi:autotransporter outer membrane beta-barrel domain-containing protein [Cupriavidus necator]
MYLRVGIGVLFMTCHTLAPAATWVGTTGDWFTPGNWSTGSVPTAADDAVIDTRSAVPPVILSPGATARGLFVGGYLDPMTQSAISGQGTLSIAQGGQLDNLTGDNVLIGVGNGSQGSLSVTGSGSRWTTSGIAMVGVSGGTGDVSVQEGALVQHGALFVGASLSDVLGLPVANGTGPSQGTYTVANGGQLSSAFFIDIGVGRNTQGILRVTGNGSAASSDGSIYVGALGGTGHLDVLAGASLATGVHGPYPFSVIGGGGPSNMGTGPAINGGVGSALISGAGSSWKNSASLYVGGFIDPNNGTLYPGTGSITVSDGATMTSVGGLSNGLPDAVGFGTGAVGRVLVTGANSRWNAGENLVVGFAGGDGTLTIEQAGALEVRGILGVGVGIASLGQGGTGRLTVQGGGTLLSNSAATTNAGAVIGGGDSTGQALVTGAGSRWTINGQLFLGGEPLLGVTPGRGSLTVADTGIVQATSGFVLAPESGSTAQLNIGAAPGAPAAAPGELSTPTIAFGAGTGSLHFNHTGTDYRFSPSISGPGSLQQLAGTTVLSGNSTYTGTTTVSGGTLAVSGTLGNTAVTVNGTGRLAGTGAMAGPVAVQAGGTIAPGNSIGTLTLNNDFRLAAGAVYQAELASTGEADHLDVSGAAVIENGAILDLVKTDASPYRLGTRYTLLTARNGIQGGNLTLAGASALPFIELSPLYDATHLYLDVRRSQLGFAQVGLTPNARAVGGAIEQLSPDHAVYQAIAFLPTVDAARTAFARLSGELHASLTSAMFEDLRVPRAAILDRLRERQQGPADPRAMTPPAGAASVAADPDERAPASAGWGYVFGDFGRLGGHDTATVERTMTGFIVGADTAIAEPARIGLAAGYTKSWVDLRAQPSSGTIEQVFGSLYGTATFDPLRLRAGILASRAHFSTARTVDITALQEREQASYAGNALQAFGELAWPLAYRGWHMEPFLGGMVMHAHTDGFTESGGAAALTGQSRSSDIQTSTVGMRWLVPGGAWTLRGLLGWQHAYGDVTPSAALRFGAASNPFTVTGTPIARNSLLAELGIEWLLSKHISGGLFGSASYAGDAHAYAVAGRLKIGF